MDIGKLKDSCLEKIKTTLNMDTFDECNTIFNIIDENEKLKKEIELIKSNFLSFVENAKQIKKDYDKALVDKENLQKALSVATKIKLDSPEAIWIHKGENTDFLDDDAIIIISQPTHEGDPINTYVDDAFMLANLLCDKLPSGTIEKLKELLK